MVTGKQVLCRMEGAGRLAFGDLLFLLPVVEAPLTD